MANKVYNRRGNKANVPALSKGELAVAIDTGELIVGANEGNVAVQRGVKTASCTTAAATAAKDVTLTGYTLSAGHFLAVTYTNGNTANSPTINVNATGAKQVRLGGSQPTGASGTGAAYCASGGVVLYYFDGTYFNQLGSNDITDDGLTSVAWSAISGKPNTISGFGITDAGTAATKNTGTASGNVPVLDTNGKLPASVIPATTVTDVTGNAATATKLQTARTIAISGGVTGTATSFDGSANISIPVTALDVSKATAGTLPVGRGGTGVTTITGLIKGNGTGAFTAAVADTDYYKPRSNLTKLSNIGTATTIRHYKIITVTPGSADIDFQYEVTGYSRNPESNFAHQRFFIYGRLSSTGILTNFGVIATPEGRAYSCAVRLMQYADGNVEYWLIPTNNSYQYFGLYNIEIWNHRNVGTVETTLTNVATLPDANVTFLNTANGINTNSGLVTGFTCSSVTATPAYLYDRYSLPLAGGTMTNTINSSKVTSTFLAGNQGGSIINSTAAAGGYVMVDKTNSTNGYFTHGTYQDKHLLQYTAKTTVDAGTNSVTKSVTLLDEAGNSSFPGTVTASVFSGNTSSATKLQTARTIQTNLASTTSVSFDGSVNITPGVTGTLSVSNGGTGLTASPSMLTNLATTTAANVLAASPRPGVTGTLSVGNGGTGVTTITGLVKGNGTGAMTAAVAGTDYTAVNSVIDCGTF